jgi:hypothetical protein
MEIRQAPRNTFSLEDFAGPSIEITVIGPSALALIVP